MSGLPEAGRGKREASRREFLKRAATLAAASTLTAVPAWALEPRWFSRQQRADWVLRGATVYDGSGGAPVEADVAVAGDRIAAVGPKLAAAGAKEIDLKGLALAPGFIDIHSHTDLVLLVDPKAQSKIRQGVTTEVLGNCGFSAAPLDARSSAMYRDLCGPIFGHTDLDWDWDALPGFLARVERQGAALNAATLVGHGPLRASVMGFENRAPSPAELERMGAAVRWEPAAIEVRGGAPLHGIEADLQDLPDAAMTLAVAALFAQGPTTLRGIGNWRVKETDRRAAMAAELAKLGARTEVGADSLVVHPPPRLRTARIATYDDHRIAMAFLVLGGVARERVAIDDGSTTGACQALPLAPEGSNANFDRWPVW